MFDNVTSALYLWNRLNITTFQLLVLCKIKIFLFLPLDWPKSWRLDTVTSRTSLLELTLWRSLQRHRLQCKDITVWFSVNCNLQSFLIVLGSICSTRAQDSHHSPRSFPSHCANRQYISFPSCILFLPTNCEVCTHSNTHTVSYTTVSSVVRKFIACSRVPVVPGLLKYPPPPIIAAHSNQPLPQLQRSGARDMLRSAISLKPHAGRLLAALWFSCACPPQPSSRVVSPTRPHHSLLIAQTTLLFAS